MIFILDNYDSFTYNLRQYLGMLGAEVVVHRNDAITLDQIKELKPEKIIISPGPGRPENAGISIELVKNLGEVIPVLGVCLGHQAIGVAFGGKVIKGPVPVHGKTSSITHDNKTIFASIQNPFTATRYHSLIIEKDSLPAELEISAEADGIIMGIRHKNFPIEGVQFHPESILTNVGLDILRNFLNL